MKSDTILKVENVSKQYRLGLVGTGSLSHDLNRWWHKVRGKEDPYLKVGDANDRSKAATSQYVWALKDIDFEVAEGEVLGIIGKNGAGKSTLLKILSRVTGPTTGSIKSKGRIASLLEVGTGFHPELTGRENIYLNGAILGMSRSEITSKIDEIVDFSGCERYIDTPTKRYSSGMTVRLAFAVAAHLEPDILVVDEVLAVGDAEFQKKAIGKMKDVSSQDGRTVLFVSHNMAAVKNLCTRAILLEQGKVVREGDVHETVDHYLGDFFENQAHHKKWSKGSEDAPRGGSAVLLEVKLVSEDDLSITSDTKIYTRFELLKDMKNFNLSVVLSSEHDIPIFNTISPVVGLEKGIHEAWLTIPKHLLNDINYRLRLLLVENSRRIVDVHDVLAWQSIETSNRDHAWFGKMIGVIRPKLQWEIC